MYIGPQQGGRQTPGHNVLMSTETSWHFGNLLLVSKHRRHNSFWKIHCFTLFAYKSIRDQIWHCRKIGHGQSSVIIWINLVVLEHPMLHTKCQGHRPFGSGEEGFFKVFNVYEHVGHIGQVTRTVWTNFRFPIPEKLHMKFDLDWPRGFRGDV